MSKFDEAAKVVVDEAALIVKVVLTEAYPEAEAVSVGVPVVEAR